VTATRKGANWRQLRPDTRKVLARLKRRYRIGLISRYGAPRHRLSVELFEKIQLAGSGTEQQKAPATRESLNGPLTSRHAHIRAASGSPL